MSGVGIIGTGFMGMAHTEALRRLGHDVVGIVGSSPERARAKAAASDVPLPPVFETVDELVAAAEVVHVTSPNHVHAEHVRAVLAAGRHVVCEKPLGVSSAETAELVALAEAAGVVHAVCFNIRHYPQNQHAAALVAAGAVGEPRFVTGRYHQDWLLLDTDWNWRLDTARQGGLRAVADIGSHWLDLTRFVSGRQVVEVFADLHTFVTERNHPVGRRRVVRRGRRRRRACARAHGERRRRQPAAALRRRAARGVHDQPGVGRAQEHDRVGARRLDAMRWRGRRRIPSGCGSGHRQRPNEIVEKDPALMRRRATRRVTSRATRTRSAPCSPRSTATSPLAYRRNSRPIRRSPTATTPCWCARRSAPRPARARGRRSNEPERH